MGHEARKTSESQHILLPSRRVSGFKLNHSQALQPASYPCDRSQPQLAHSQGRYSRTKRKRRCRLYTPEAETSWCAGFPGHQNAGKCESAAAAGAWLPEHGPPQAAVCPVTFNRGLYRLSLKGGI